MLLPDQSVMTEYSAGGGNAGMFYPLVYQGITPWDMQTLANDAQYGYDPLMPEVAQSAYLQAIVRAEEARAAYDVAKKIYHGDFCSYNDQIIYYPM